MLLGMLIWYIKVRHVPNWLAFIDFSLRDNFKLIDKIIYEDKSDCSTFKKKLLWEFRLNNKKYLFFIIYKVC